MTLAAAGEAAATPPALPRLPGELTVERLASGLTVALLVNPQAPVVSTALWYRAGTRDEPAGHGGIAHFLEHMMFKGSARFGLGEVDRRTQALGGANNAFTGHDATVYYFQFAADRWQAALEMEADRMAGLLLDPEQVESERRVILEEIAMYEDDPWDALTQRVEAELYGPHPYGRPVLGTAAELLATGTEELRAFHRRVYTPGNAVLVVAGDLGEPARALEAVERAFAPVPPSAATPERPTAPARPARSGLARIERRKGEVGRMFLALPAPAADHPDFAPLRLAAAVLGVGRSSRLYRELVDEAQRCAWAGTGLADAPDPGAFAVTAELVSGTEPSLVEEAVLRQLGELAASAPSEAELERAREVLFADWTFGHERISQQGLTAGSDLTLFRPGWSEDQVGRLAEVGAEDVRRVAERYLGQPAADGAGGGVLGWSLPNRMAGA
ncbi:MAG TPA: pitrilysin family protein [Thermoanaerobaculia bacterium]|nr:pitrilysin family protein [Thermoanaerobaculia bacterium]